MDNPTNADLDMIEALLATMHQNPAQLYDDVDDDDDDDDDDDYDDDDDDDGYYGEHNIHTLLNPYGGGDGGEMPGGDGQMNIPNVQTMNFIQGLLNMNNSSLSGMADIEAALGSTMGGAIGGMGGPMDGSSAAAAAAAGFLPTMQSLIPNMGSDMAGALAGAFAGGMGSLIDYGHGHAQNGNDYDDDDDDEDDDDEDEDEDDGLSDEEDDIDDDDDDDDDHHHQKHGRPLDPSALALGGVGGLMAASLLANSSHMANSSSSRSYSDNFQSPALLPPPHSLPTPSSTPSSPPCVPTHQSIVSAIGFCVPTPISMAPLPVSSAITSQPAIASTNVGSMSGGTVSRADPLAALVAGVGAAAIGVGTIAPIVNNLLGNSGGTTLVNNKLNASNASSTTVIGNNDSLNTSSKTLHDTDNVDAVATSMALAKISSSQSPAHTTTSSIPNVISSSAPVLKVSSPESQTKLETAPKETKLSNEECDADKTSLGSASSSTSGGGKSDTESFGKKTPSPVPEGTESTNSQEVGSYSSIPDLASTTESMRDSDDNHSEVHNVTANLSDLDNDVPEQQKPVPVSQYPVGALPVVVEHPTYGWSSMLGLDRAKEALKELFIARSFPPVFDGTEGSCKGILLFGPSGSGKTCLARALAKEANNALFVGISSRYLLTHNSFDAIKLVRCMFDQARHEKPAVILFDEIEALCYHPNNESAIRAKDEILAQVRGLTTLPPYYPPRQDPSTYNEGILVLGTTNQPWLLEDKLRRVFAYNIHVKLPAEKPRHELFRMFLQNLPHNINDEEFQCLVSKSEGYSAADINTVIRQASHRVPLDPHNESGRGHRVLTFDDLATMMTQFRCRYNDDLQQKYSAYISAATHRAEDLEDTSKDKKDKPKGVKKFSHRIAKSLAAAVLSVID